MQSITFIALNTEHYYLWLLAWVSVSVPVCVCMCMCVCFFGGGGGLPPTLMDSILYVARILIPNTWMQNSL